MKTTAQEFFAGLKGKNISVIGVGVSNNDLIRRFARDGANGTLRDGRGRDQLGELCAELETLGVTLQLGEGYLDGLNDADMVVRAPGVYFNKPELVEARRAGVPVTSEMELFLELCPCPVYAVTGSDGKTTTTSIIAEMLKAAGFTVHLGGNIGRALLPIVEQVQPGDRAVVELSSFQLMSITAAPQVSVITNITPNHLNVHGTMEEYTGAKEHVFLHQNAFSRTVLSADNEVTNGLCPKVRGSLSQFSRRKAVERGAWADAEGVLYYNDGKQTLRLMTKEDIKIPGWHNVENYLAAISAVWGEVSPETMLEVARSFGGVEHRIEFVREVEGVRWYNDSIATSPTRTIAGLQCFPNKIIIIAGGYDKKIPFEPLAPEIVKHVKELILTGPTAQKIRAAVVADPGYDPAELKIVDAADLADAVAKASADAVAGDVVSRSPACASFDAYPNFEVRGRHFKELVNAL
ncbi:MAG: UDP-N-acetylmuramoyl-L-alanine--D-glutamate ligase [Oscillospiraceae bacterium]|nr:UDP-N-acetylmuramoyl-L-alanine--D-glutamate ligase [Oscillospiraceae bacterium]